MACSIAPPFPLIAIAQSKFTKTGSCFYYYYYIALFETNEKDSHGNQLKHFIVITNCVGLNENRVKVTEYNI